MKPYKPANPMIWGAVTGLIAAAIVLGSDLTGSVRPDNPLLVTPFNAGFAGLGMGAMVATLRNWFNERHRPGS